MKVHSTPLKGISVRRDKNAISLFDRSNGTKVRFAIGPYTKAKRPELVDIKITDFCPAQCSFCLDPDTMVTLNTMRRVPIKDLNEGDKIWAFNDPFVEGNKYFGTPATVERKWHTSKESLRIHFEDGRSVTASVDHKFLMARMGWRQADKLKPGDRIRCHSLTPTQEETPEFMCGYLAGFSRGDGAFRNLGKGCNGRYVRLSCGDRETIDRIYAYMDYFDLGPNIKELWIPEGFKTCWAIEKRSQTVVEWFESARIFDVSSTDYGRGFVSGFFDSDGSSNGMKAIRFHQKNDMEAFELVREVLVREEIPIGATYVSSVTGINTMNVSSNLESVERFCNIFIPANTNRNFIRSNKTLGKERFCRIESVESVGVRDLIDIQTSTGTFFAEGLATHNCYQGSTPSGAHSSMENMEKVIHELAKAKVQEVANGGGETTYHPQFAEICKKFAQAGVVPNFTTKYPARVRMHWDNIKDYIGGFAYSAETPKNIYDAAKLLKRAGIPDHKVSLHHVMGLSRQGQFREYMQAAHDVGYRVTLLGYKTTGRGKNVTPFPYDWWIEEMNSLIREGRCPSTSIDTPLAEQYDGLMPVEPTMYHTREGAFSMYIDAVQMKMGASSFDESVDLVPFDKDWVARYKHL